MKGIILEKPGGEYLLSDSVAKPTPGKNQILVKSLVTGLNPVEGIQQQGMLVTAWPIVLGCDASGIVVAVGEDVKKFKQGDGVFGCTRLGEPGYGTFQEYFLMDEHITFKTPANITSVQAATIGVGLLTASMGLVSGTKMPLEAQPQKSAEDSEWVVIFGAAGSVGQYGVQLVEGLGADATLSHRIPVAEQLQGIATITGGKFSRVFDASAMAGDTGMQALADQSSISDSAKYFTTTNDWAPVEPRKGVEIHLITLGLIGKSGGVSEETVNKDIETYIPKLEQFLESGVVKPNEYEQVGDIGVEEVLKGLGAFKTRKNDGKKLVVRVSAD
ncbi:GroES-like protein [Venustampulla echinocandica]|uniref:GroES-like protein n=1 Tax=Venustampulla echinocandica TaxID=2656787 RepID=A0A370TS62_9HELO|nr:GroES-like protein [Venustampulla echinocandica]RDL38343.1 GroES-like protein [Venustampulla echinocandica]